MPNKNKKRFLNEKVFPFGKGIVFGLGLLAIGLVTAQVDIDFDNFSSGGQVTARNFNRLIGILQGLRNDEGMIGIGEIDPTEALHVGGNVLITGNLTASNLNADGDVTVGGSLKGLNSGFCEEGQAINGFVDSEISCIDLPTIRSYVRLMANDDNGSTVINYTGNEGNDTVELTWTTFDVAEEGCFLDGGEFDFVEVDPDRETVLETTDLRTSTTYILYCAREGEQMMFDTVGVIVNNVPLPTVTLEVTGANPIDFGETTTLSWTSENADTCQMSCYGSCTQGWIDGLNNEINPEEDVTTEVLTEDTNYTIYCTGDGGVSDYASVDVGVNGTWGAFVFGGNNDWGDYVVAGEGIPPVIESFTIDDNEIIEGESTTLRWDSDGTSCIINDGSNFYEQAGRGSMSTGNLEASTGYTIICLNEEPLLAGSEEENVTVTVVPPRIRLTANPNPVEDWTWNGFNIAGNAQIYWQVRDMVSCSIDGAGELEWLTMGNDEEGVSSGIYSIDYVYNQGQDMPDYIDYTVECTGVDDQELSENVQINLAPTMIFRAVATPDYENTDPFLNWTTFGGVCTMSSSNGDGSVVDSYYSGRWTDANSMSLGNNTYILECVNNSGTVSEEVIVEIVPRLEISDFTVSPTSVRSRNESTTVSWHTMYAGVGTCRANLGQGSYEYDIPDDNVNGIERTVDFRSSYTDFHLICDGTIGRGEVGDAKVRLCNTAYYEPDEWLCGQSCYGLDCVIE